MKKLIIPFCLLLTACTDRATGPTSQPAPAEQEFLFEVSYVNYAWGQQINGVYIDNRGDIYTYDHSQTTPVVFGKDEITHADLEEKFANRTLIGHTDEAELQQMTRRIETAARGTLVESDSGCRDFGGLSYLAYQFNPETRLYTQVRLFQAGDWAARNESVSAAILYQWLVRVSGREPQGCLPN